MAYRVLFLLSVAAVVFAVGQFLAFLFLDLPIMFGWVIVDRYDPGTGKVRAIHFTPLEMAMRSAICIGAIVVAVILLRLTEKVRIK